MTPTIQVYKPGGKRRERDEDFVMYDEHHTEKVLWSSRPSEFRFLWIYVICVLTFWLVLPVFAIIILHIHNQNTKYILTNERLRICTGLFVKRIVDLELYRVKDMSIVLPFYLSFFGLGTLELRTSDPTNPFVSIEAVPYISKIEEMIRHHVEKRRDDKKVQEIDQYRYQ